MERLFKTAAVLIMIGAAYEAGREKGWVQGFKFGQEVLKSQENNHNDIGPGPKISVIFKTTQGISHILVVNYGVTIDELLKKYLKRIGRPDLIGDNRIHYILNASELKFGDKTTVDYYNLI